MFRSMLALLLFMSGSALAGPAEEANAVVTKWAETYSANDAGAMVELYTPDAIFLGTVSPDIGDTIEAREAYFARLPGTGNTCSIGEHRTMVLSDTAVVVTGFYDFKLMRDGKPVEVHNRFSMVVVKRDDEWLIAHHHSSRRPQPSQ